MLKIVYNSVDSEATGCQRVLNPLKIMQDRGLIETQIINRSDARKQAKWADVLFLQCLIGPQNFDLLALYQKEGIPVVVDYDDNFAHLPPNILSRIGLSSEDAKNNWIKYLNMADAVTCPSHYLAQRIKFYSKPKRVCILPNYLTEEEYTGSKDYSPWKVGEDEIRILYSCSDTHQEDLQWVGSLLCYLGEAYPQVRIITQGSLDFKYLFPYYKGKSSHALYAPYKSYHQSLREIAPHICLGPLLNNEHAYSRSDIKYLQTASIKAAFVGSNSPPYQETVISGYTGLLPSNSKLSWWWSLRKLIRNPELIRSIGEAAYKHAGQFLLKDHVESWFWVFNDLVSQNDLS